MKLEIKHLAPYLPYSLKVSKLHTMHTCLGIGSIDHILSTQKENYKPILRSLSNYADINSDAMNSLNCDLSDQIQISEFASKRISLSSLSVSAYNVCLANHIDVFDLIDNNLARPLI